MITRLPPTEYEAAAPQGEIATAVELLNGAALQRRLELVAADDDRPDRHAAAEIRQAVRHYSFLAEAFRL